jgi:hypothetical protein
MQSLFKIRLDLKTNEFISAPTKFYVTNSDIDPSYFKEHGYLSESEWLTNKKTSDFIINAAVVCAKEFSQLPVDQNIKKSFLGVADTISFIEIEMGISRKDEPFEVNQTYTLPKHSLALSYARKLLLPYNLTVELVIVKDYYNHSTQTIVTPAIETLPPGAKYRLYLDNVIISERFLPYDILNNEVLEENVYIDILRGLHTVRIENLSKNKVSISAICLDGQIHTNINSDSYSFEFR